MTDNNQQKPEGFKSGDIKMYDRDGNETTREKMQVKRGAVLQNQGQRVEEINGKLTINFVRWLDEERTLVECKYFDSEGWGRVENHTANASGPGTFFSKILQQYTIDDIDNDTAEFWRAENEAMEDFRKFQEWKAEGGLLGAQIDEDEFAIGIIELSKYDCIKTAKYFLDIICARIRIHMYVLMSFCKKL